MGLVIEMELHSGGCGGVLMSKLWDICDRSLEVGADGTPSGRLDTGGQKGRMMHHQ